MCFDLYKLKVLCFYSYFHRYTITHTHTHTHTNAYTQWPQNTLTASLKRGKTFPTNVLDMTLNNLIVRLQ